MKRIARRIWRNTRGSSLIEMSAGVFVLMLFAIGIAQFATLSMDIDRDGRAIRSGLDLAWQIDAETDTPGSEDIEAMARALGVISKLSEGDAYRLHVSVFDADATGTAALHWQQSAGNRADYPPSLVELSGGAVLLDGRSFTVEDDEKLIVVEIMRDGHGMARGEIKHRYGVAYKADPTP